MASPTLQTVVAPLIDATWTLAAVSAALEAGLVAALTRPRMLAELGAETAVPPDMLRSLLDVLASSGVVPVQAEVVTPDAALAALAGDAQALHVLRDDLRRSLGENKQMKKTNIAAGLITCLFATSAIMNDTQAQSWSLNGNAGTTSSNYIGTSDSKSFTIKTARAKRITVTSGGKVGVGTAYSCIQIRRLWRY